MAIFSGRKYSWLWVIWVIVGLVLAWTHTYLTLVILKVLLSAVLAALLWPLVLLGVNLHVR